MKSFVTIIFTICLISMILISACSSSGETIQNNSEKEIVLERQLSETDNCQSFNPNSTIEMDFFYDNAPTLVMVSAQDTLALAALKHTSTKFPSLAGVSFYAHFNAEGEIYKVEVSGNYDSDNRPIIKEIAESLSIRFNDDEICHRSGMISGTF